MTLGDRIAAKREEMGCSQRQLGKLAGVPHTVISELERNVREVATSDVVKKLACTLGVSADYLIGTWDEDAEMASRRRCKRSLSKTPDVADLTAGWGSAEGSDVIRLALTGYHSAWMKRYTLSHGMAGITPATPTNAATKK